MSDTTRTFTRANRIGGFVYVGLSGLFAVCVTAQIFLAGMAIFVDSSHWRDHTVFVRVFELFPVLMLIASFVGKLPNGLRWMCAVIFLLIYAQYFTAHLPGAGALHPVIAAVLFWVAVQLTSRSAKWIFPKRLERQEIAK